MVLENFFGNVSFAVGHVKYGTPIGKVFFKYKNGDVYEGKSKDFVKHGKGCYHFANGDCIVGRFKRDKLVGKALYVTANNEYYACKYKNGEQISRIKIN